MSGITGPAGMAAPPPSNDPFFASVVLLLPFQDVNGSTGAPGFTDYSPAAHGIATVSGNGQISTANFPFAGAASSYLGDGTGDGMTFPDSIDWKLSSANSDQFTVDVWFRLASGTTVLDKFLIAQGTTAGSLGWRFCTTNTGNGELNFVGCTNGSTFWTSSPVTSGLTWVANQWYILSADKDATGNVRVYRQGVMVASNTPTSSVITDSVAALCSGMDNVAARSINGNLYGARITKGVARYQSDAGYVVPTAPWPMS